MKSQLNYIFLQIILSLIFISRVYSQELSIKFEHITTEQGLSSNIVYDIIQDHRGFMWFATRNGLNRFDGYHIKEFKYSPQDTHSMAVSWCASLHEDRYGKLWIGTLYGGLNAFDPITEKFITFKNDPKNIHSISNDVVLAISEDDSGNFWLGTWHGLNFLHHKYIENPDPRTAQFVHYNHDPNNPNSLSDDRIWTIYIDREGIIWIGTDAGGLNRFDPITEIFKHYRHDRNDLKGLRHNRITCIYEDPALKKRTLWIGTLMGGLHRFDVTSEIFERENLALPESPGWGFHTVMSVRRDRNGYLWSGTWHGLKRYIYENKEVFPQKFIVYNKDNCYLSSNQIKLIYEDRTGILWLSTVDDGINRIRISKRTFYGRKHVGGNCIYEDQNGILWTGGMHGLYQINRQEKSMTIYPHRPNDTRSISSKEVYAIVEEPDCSNQTLWLLCRHGGLDELILKHDPAAGHRAANIDHILPIRYDSMSQACKYGLALVRDKNGMLWIGANEGLFQFDPKNGRVAPYQSDPADPKTRIKDRVDRIYQSPFDLGNILWLGTNNGLYHVDLDRNKVTHYKPDPQNINSLNDSRIISLLADAPTQGKILWIGTFSGGLNRFDVKQGTFSHFTQDDGLPSNTIYSILQDDRGSLWLGTDNGLTKLNPQTKAHTTYTYEDSLIFMAFYPGGAFKSPRTGEMFFGGDGGFISFHPDSIINNSNIPSIVLTDFKVDNKTIKLDTSINNIKQIKLSYQQNFFSFQFATLDYTNPSKNQYAYMLDGLEKDWKYSGNRNFADYTDINPGKYTFRVKGSNNDGVWNEDGTSVKIIITPPFWKTWWFRISFAFIILSTVFQLYYRHVSRIKRERQKQQEFSKRLIEVGEQERKRIASELHDSLGQNLLITKNEIQQCLISHPLPDQCLESLKEISTIVTDSINELREISYNLHPHQLDRLGLKKAIESIIHRLVGLSEIKFAKEIDDIDNVFQKDMEIHIFRIIQEGLNNIVKHAEASNAIITIKKKNSQVNILIQDDGKGFNYKAYASGHIENRGFGLSGISEKVRILNGKLIIDSAPGNGTTIEIKIPI